MTDNGGQRYVPPDGDHGAREDAMNTWFKPSGDRHRTQSEYQDIYSEPDAAGEGGAGPSGAPGGPAAGGAPAPPSPQFPQNPQEQRQGGPAPQEHPAPQEQQGPRSAFPSSGGYPGAGAERPGMAEPYPAALGDPGMPADPRAPGPTGAPGGEEGPPPSARPYAAPAAERPGEPGRESPGGQGFVGGTGAGWGDARTGHPAERPGAEWPGSRRADEPAAWSGRQPSAGGGNPGESTVGGYRIPGTPATGPENAPLPAAGGTGGYPGFGSSVRSGPDAAAPGQGAYPAAPGAGGPAPYPGAAAAAERGAAPDTEPFPAGGASDANGRRPYDEPRPGADAPAGWRGHAPERDEGVPPAPGRQPPQAGSPYQGEPSGSSTGAFPPHGDRGVSEEPRWVRSGERPADTGSAGWSERGWDREQAWGSPQPWSPYGGPEGGERGVAGWAAETDSPSGDAGERGTGAFPPHGDRGVSEEPRWDRSGEGPANGAAEPFRGPGEFGADAGAAAAGAQQRWDSPQPWSPNAPPADERSTGDFPGYGDRRDYGDRPRNPDPALGAPDAVGAPAYGDRRDYGDRPEPSWGAPDRPERYDSGAGYRLDAEDGPSLYSASGAGGAFDGDRFAGAAGRRGAESAGAGYDDGYDDELSRPYSRRIEEEADQPAPGGDLGGPRAQERGAGPEQGGDLGTGSGNTWAFSRDDTRLPESVREAAAEAQRKRRDGSPDHTTHDFLSKGDGGAGRPDPDSDTASGAAQSADFGADPLAAIAAQQARARSGGESGGEDAARPPNAGEADPGAVGGGTQEMPALSDELGPDLRSGPGAPGEVSRDRRDPYDPYGGYGAAERSAPEGEYERYADYDRYPGGGPTGASGGDYSAGAYSGGYDPLAGTPGPSGGYGHLSQSGYAAGDPAGSGAPQGAAGEWGRSDGFTEAYPGHTDLRGGEPHRQDGYGDGPGYAGLSSSAAPGGDYPDQGHDASGPSTAAMSLRDLEAADGQQQAEPYGPDAYRGGPGEYGAEPYGPDAYRGAPGEYGGHPEEPRGRPPRDRDPVGEDFPDFDDRLLDGEAGDPYPGYDNIDHWPDTAPEASATLWLGVAALLPVIGLFTAIAALVMGPRARRAIRSSEGELEGLNLVLLGTIGAWVGIGLAIVEVAGFLGAFVLT